MFSNSGKSCPRAIGKRTEELRMCSYSPTVRLSVSVHSRSAHSQRNSMCSEVSATSLIRSFTSRQSAWFRAALTAWMPPSDSLAMRYLLRVEPTWSHSVEESASDELAGSAFERVGAREEPP